MIKNSLFEDEDCIPCGEIYRTKNHDKFNLLTYNREIVEKEVLKRMQEIRKKNKLSVNPIKVTDTYDVIDGQHRLEAARRLDLHIYYIIDYDFTPEDLVPDQTDRRGWSTADYIHHYIARGKKDYEAFEKLRIETGLSIRILIIWIGNKTKKNSQVTGAYTNFKAGYYYHSVDNVVLKSLDTLKRFKVLMKIKNFKPLRIYEDNHFHAAIKNFFGSPLVDHEAFLEKYNNNPHLLRFCESGYEFCKNFVEIYNHHRLRGKLFVTENNGRINISE